MSIESKFKEVLDIMIMSRIIGKQHTGLFSSLLVMYLIHFLSLYLKVNLVSVKKNIIEAATKHALEIVEFQMA